jgi:hypothetical protein
MSSAISAYKRCFPVSTRRPSKSIEQECMVRFGLVRWLLDLTCQWSVPRCVASHASRGRGASGGDRTTVPYRRNYRGRAFHHPHPCEQANRWLSRHARPFAVDRRNIDRGKTSSRTLLHHLCRGRHPNCERRGRYLAPGRFTPSARSCTRGNTRVAIDAHQARKT